MKIERVVVKETKKFRAKRSERGAIKTSQSSFIKRVQESNFFAALTLTMSCLRKGNTARVLFVLYVIIFVIRDELKEGITN